MRDWENNGRDSDRGRQSINAERKRAQEIAEERRKWLAGEKYVYDAPRKQGSFTPADRERPIAPTVGKAEQKQNRSPAKGRKKKSKKNSVDYRSNDERRRDYAAGARKKRRRSVIRALIFTVVIAACVLVALSLTVLFKIETISVSGDTRYTAEEVIEASGVKNGDNLWRTTSQNVTDKLSAALPYVGFAKIVRSVPSSVEIVITETVPVYSIEKNNKYILIDENNKILETQAAKAGDTVLLKGVEPLEAKAGELLNVKVSEKYETAKEIINEAAASGLKLTEVNVTDLNLLTAVYSGKLRLEFGSKSDLADKMKMAEEVITKLEMENNKQQGVINLKSVTKAFFKEEPLNPTSAPKNNGKNNKKTESGKSNKSTA